MILGNPFTNDTRVAKEAHSLTRAGYAVTIYAIWKRDLPLYEEVDRIKIKRLNISRYSPVAFVNFFRVPFEVIPSVLKLIKEKADIYHAHDLDTLFSASIAAKANKAKLVYDSHELYLEVIKARRSKTIWSKLKFGMMHFAYSLIEKSLISKADAVITVSSPIKDILLSNYDLEKITVIMNCPAKADRVTNTKKFHQIFSLPKNSKIVLYQGAMALDRGLNYLIDAVKYFPDDTYLVMMGNGADLLKLKELVTANKLEEMVKFIPAVSLEELPFYTASADIGVVQLLNTSLNNFYSLPNKLFEYMGVGLPIAAVNFPNLRKVVNGDKVGILFKGDDPKDIARAINEVLSNNYTKEEMSRNALKASKEKYNWEIEEKKLLKIYKEL